MQPRFIYFFRNDQGIETNRNLGFTKSVQAILAYNWALNTNWHLRVETYFQYLYKVPVVDDPNSTLSLLNFGASYHISRPDNLINKGEGYNYGIEIGIERYFQNNFYILSNVSLYTSKITIGILSI